MTHPIRVLICGAGSSAHVLAGVISTKLEVELRILTLSAAKAHRWQRSIDAAPMMVMGRNGEIARNALRSSSVLITDNPQDAARDCDIVLFAVPAFLHWQYLTLLEPYIQDGCVIVGLPGQSGFEFEVRKVLGRRADNCILMNFDSLPWVCRIVEFGKAVQVCGTKDNLVGAVQGDLSRARVKDPLAALQHLLGETPRLKISGHLLGITLRSPNAYSHPPIMYGRWKDWDGQPLNEPPLFYHDIDEETADLLGKISEEVVETGRQLMAQYPQADMSQVIPMYDWDMCCYAKDIKDKTNLMTALRTNSGYAAITHPMVRTGDGGYVPDFNHRFLTEDVPFGLVVVRSIAEIAGSPTPHIDAVLAWCQEKMGKEYLVGSRLIGKDISETRCAQRYGFTTTEEILGYESKLDAVLAQ